MPYACSTGRAAGTNATWFCPLDIPAGAFPTSSGRHCYDVQANCYASNNPCSRSSGSAGNATAAGLPGFSCKFDALNCSTGIAGIVPAAWVCEADTPPGFVTSFTAGVPCYDTSDNCMNGLNRCSGLNPCVNTLNTEKEGVCPYANPYFCPTDVPNGASAEPSGMCYTTVTTCLEGPNRRARGAGVK